MRESGAVPLHHREKAMDANFDADLEQLNEGIYSVKPHDEVEVLLFREEEVDEFLDDQFDGLTGG
jgi:hypothetical protein